MEVLENLPRHNDWIFPQDTTDERPMTPPKHVWKKVRQLTGFHDLRMHDLRHTFASLRLAGGLGRRLRVFRLPDENPHRAVTLERRVALHADRDNAVYVRVTQEDGHLVWSSPIYLFR